MARPKVCPHRPAIEIADILRRHGDAYRRLHAGHLGRVERRVMSAIVACRTEALGGHVEACNECGMTRIAYNSCRNWHCPKCQGAARSAWLAAREADLLPVPYFQMHLEGADVFQLQSVRRSAKISAQLRNRADVGSLRRRRRSRTVMSSIMRRRRGLKSAI